MHSITRGILQSIVSSDTSLSKAEQLVLARLIEGRIQEQVLTTRDMGTPLLVTQAQAAKLLGLSRVTVWRMAKEGMLHPVEILPDTFRYAFAEISELAKDGIRRKPAASPMGGLPQGLRN